MTGPELDVFETHCSLVMPQNNLAITGSGDGLLTTLHQSIAWINENSREYISMKS